MNIELKEFYMRETLKEAEEAKRIDEVPVGCVIVYKKKIVARAHNQIRKLKDPTAHAEMIAITQAANFLQSERLNECYVFVTIESCPMCAGALVLARIERLIYGAEDPKAGACGSVINIINHPQLNHRIKVERGILEQECSVLLQEFFKNKRSKFLT